MSSEFRNLADLGWSAHFLSQLTLDELGRLEPLRLVAVQRDRATALGRDGECILRYPAGLSAGDTVVGDWVLADPDSGRIERVLGRRSEIARKAAGSEGRRQLIAANVDTLFIVTSCNAEFSVARLERYLAVALDAGVTPVVVLTKSDLADDPGDYAARTRNVSARIADVLALNATDPAAHQMLAPWLGRGQTVAFAGSSGVGKSTLIGGLIGRPLATQGIREDDAKGRHTTTARSIYRTPAGALVIDTPGMRELGLSDAADGIAAVFDDVEALAAECRFSDCTHDGEPGCAVTAAVADGRLDPARLGRWRKLRREDARNTETVHERRRRVRAFGRMVKEAGRNKRR